MLVVFFRALILFIVVFLVIRLMGKRELSKVQPFELAIIILISDLASAPMSSRSISIFDGIVPMITLLIMYILFTFLIQSSNKVQTVISGNAVVLIENGIINEKELKKQQYTISELTEQLREKDVFRLQDVKYAILETNGKINIVKTTDNIINIPLNLIEDGTAMEDNLHILNISADELEEMLNAHKLKKEEVLIASLDENDNFIFQLKKEV